MSTGGTGAFFQNSFYVGNTFNAILYGVELVLYFQTMNRLWRATKRDASNKFLMFFSTMLLFCITVFMATQSILAQEMWVVHQDWPGGSVAYFLQYSAAWYETLGSTASVVLQLMSDALLIHRCWTVWCGNLRIIVFPTILWVATFVFAILELYASGTPDTDFFAGFAAHVGLVYFTLTIALNVITTSIICYRIMTYAKRMRNTFGGDFGSTYLSLVSIIIESALPYTLSGIAFLVAFGMQSEFSVFLLSIYGMFTCISPQMLVLRVAEGQAWSRDTATRYTTGGVEFNHTIEMNGVRITGESDTVIIRDGEGPFDNSGSEKSMKVERV